MMSRTKYIIIFCAFCATFFYALEISGQIAKKEVNAARISSSIHGFLNSESGQNKKDAYMNNISIIK